MWSHIFALGVPFGEKLVRPLLVYAFLVVALRLAGKRELAQLTTLDFIVLLAVANAVQNGIIGDDSSVTGAVLGASMLFAVNALLIRLVYRHLRLRRLISGRPTVLVSDGRLDEVALRHEGLSAEDLLGAVEEAGASSFAEVQRLTLEPNGKLLVQLPRPVPLDAGQTEVAAGLAELRAQVADLTALVRQGVPRSEP